MGRRSRLVRCSAIGPSFVGQARSGREIFISFNHRITPPAQCSNGPSKWQYAGRC
jgi:hypothetical protein